MRKLPTKTDIFVRVTLLAFFTFLMWESRSYPEKSALFPRLLGGVSSILIVISLTSDLVRFRKKWMGKTVATQVNLSDHTNEPSRWTGKEKEEDEIEEGYEFLADRIRKKRIFQTLFITIVSLAIGYFGGFLWIVPFFFAAFGFLQGEAHKKFNYVLLALVSIGVTYLFFVVLMGVPLLRGIWRG